MRGGSWWIAVESIDGTKALCDGTLVLGRSLRPGSAPRYSSGTLKHKRLVWGGRAPVRAALFMAALVGTRRNPELRAFLSSPARSRKPKKVALTAWMRKLLTILNAMMGTNTVWRHIDPSRTTTSETVAKALSPSDSVVFGAVQCS